MGRLTFDFIRIVQLRRTAAPAVYEEQQLCRQLAARMKVTPPELLRTPFISGPCLAGVWQPAILLPEELPTTPLNTVLVHELAHLRRGDCFWNLLRQASVSVLFIQPLAWRLSRRIEATAEEVCDDHAVQFGADRQSYAELLVQLAERTLLVPPSVAVPLVTFRSLLARRVGRVLDHSRRLSLTVGLAALSLIIAAGLGGTLLTGLLGSSPQTAAAAPQADAKAEGKMQKAEKAASAAESSPSSRGEGRGEGTVAATDLKLHYRGQVLDPDGKPVAGAKVFFVHWIHGGHPDSSFKPLAVTDAQGWFDFTAPQPATESPVDKKWLSAPIVASAAGYGPAVAESVDFETTGELKKQLPAAALSDLQKRLSNQPVLKLVKDDVPITGRIVNTEGNPVAGVRLRVNELWFNPQGNLDPWETAAKDANVDFNLLRSKAPAGMNGPQLPAIISDVQTDGDGRFTLPGVGRERIAQLLVSAPGIESKLVWARTRAGRRLPFRCDVAHPADCDPADSKSRKSKRQFTPPKSRT